MKRLKIILSKFISFILAFCCVFTVNSEMTDNESEYDNLSSYEVLENNKYRLSVDRTNGYMYIKNKETNCTVCSNPENAQEDTVAVGDQANILKSQIVVYYYDGEKYVAVDSYSKCIGLGKEPEIENDGNKINVGYKLGDESFTGDMLPSVISKSRMEKDVFSKISASDRKKILERYTLMEKKKLSREVLKSVEINFPIIKKHDIYVKSEMPDYIAEEVYDIFKKAGYSTDDLQRDCDENKVENKYKEKPYFNLTLSYELNSDGFNVSINPKTVEYSNSYLPNRIEILPLMGAADKSEKGYIFVPDGSGALINLNNGKTSETRYWKKLFGTDYALSADEKSANSKESLLPVFALSSSKQSFWASIDAGYESAGISALVSGIDNEYNYIYPFFELFASDFVSISSNQYDVFKFSSEKIFSSEINISYHFMTGNNSYSEIAKAYREYLQKNGILPKESKIESRATFNADFIATAQVTKRFFGIPYNSTAVLTSFLQAGKIIDDLKVKKSDAVFYSALKGGIKQKGADSLKPISLIGSEKDRTMLQNRLNNLYVSYYAQRAATLKKSDSTVRLNQDKAKIYNYDTVSRYYIKDDYMMLLSTSKLLKYLKPIKASIKKNKISAVNILDLGYSLYRDFGNNMSDKFIARKNAQKYLSGISDIATLSLEKGSIYSLKYADKITHIPTSSSRYRIEDCSVPFYQIVISGIIPYTCEPINLSDNYIDSFLNAIETGAELSYSLVYRMSDNILYNSEKYFGRIYYENKDDIKKDITLYSKYAKVTDDACLISHDRLSDTVVSTGYSNGATVIINYGNCTEYVKGKTIQKKSFIVLEKGE